MIRAMKRLISALIAGTLLTPLIAFAAGPDATSSRMSADKTALRADGIDNARISVTIKDANLSALANTKVILTSSRGTLDMIKVESDTTDSLGKAYFRVSSLKDGTSVLSVSAGGVTILKTATITFAGGLVADVQSGDLIKIPDDNNATTLSDTAVYYYGADGRRYVFPNEKVYFTWYSNFSKVKILQVSQMSLIPIGGNVTYKAGSKLVKFQTDVKTYLPTKGGNLRWVQTEAVARGYFGTDWNQHVDDISEAFYVNYKFGEPIANTLDVAIDVIRATGITIDSDKGLQ